MKKESIKVGQKVKVISKDNYMHGFKIKEIITVITINRTTCFCNNGRFDQFVEFAQIAPIIENLNKQTKVI